MHVAGIAISVSATSLSALFLGLFRFFLIFSLLALSIFTANQAKGPRALPGVNLIGSSDLRVNPAQVGSNSL